jgi:hypothetical protein
MVVTMNNAIFSDVTRAHGVTYQKMVLFIEAVDWVFKLRYMTQEQVHLVTGRHSGCSSLSNRKRQ